ncbi:hypothetical protein AGMMS49921_11670 [Endomicrobiia bacterium]|nr:hypothetical protein AGMMS49921_11670 [Endomicrobiia bacterium]
MFYNVYHKIGGDDAFIQWALKEKKQREVFLRCRQSNSTEVPISGSNDPTSISLNLPPGL